MPGSDEDDDHHSALEPHLADASPGNPDAVVAAGPLVSIAARAAATPTTPAKDLFSPLSRIPLDVADFRVRLFTLDAPVTFDQQSWERYWPYIDNVWCLHNRQDAPDGLARGKTEKFWGGCRLQRKWDHPSKGSPGQGLRNRTRRETGTCPAKFKLTVMPNGTRVLERSSKDNHSHDLDHLDSIKRNSGVRALVLDPFFNAWEPAGILAYLRDPAHYIHGRDMLSEGGGKYLERREIMNIFAQNLKKMYPGLDMSAVRKEQEKYKAVKMCNFKGCNLAFPDSKALTAHRKSAHVEKKHDHSDKMYTCPNKSCHRRKKSKGFVNVISLREHQLRMQHWGAGIFHGPDGATECEPVTEENALEMQASAMAAREAQAAANQQAADAEEMDEANSPEQQDQPPQPPTPAFGAPNTTQQPLPALPPQPQHQQRQDIVQQPLPTDLPMLPLLHDAVQQMSAQDQHMMHIDPAIQQQAQQSAAHHLHPGLQGQQAPLNEMQTAAMLQRYNQLQQEMHDLRAALIQSGIPPMQ